MRAYGSLVRHAGNKDLFQAIALSTAALSGNYPFHVHAEGLRGTGKTTVLRAAGQLLPPIVRVKGCVYNCRPDHPHCPVHSGMSRAELAAVGREVVPCPFLEISPSAKIGTILGSIDLGRLLDRTEPRAALLPGTILQANRGVIFVDEINRLADTAPELADVLLDVMGTKPGRVQVEETGLPTVEMPVEVTVWAASNPDEEPGPLSQVRKQLADRFDLAVTMGRPSNHDAIMAILARRERADALPPALDAGGDYRLVAVSDELRRVVASVYLDFSLESLRAVEGLETAARIAARQAGRTAAVIADVAAVAPLVLGHRTDNATLAGILRYLQAADTFPAGTAAAGAGGTLPDDGGAAATPESPSRTMWARLWGTVGKYFGRGRRSAVPPGVRPGPQRGGSPASAGKVVDPATVEITAPPVPGQPLSQLPASQYVSRADGKNDE